MSFDAPIVSSTDHGIAAGVGLRACSLALRISLDLGDLRLRCP